MNVRGRFPLKVRVENKEVEHDFYVVKSLNEPVIFGIDFIERNELNYCPTTRSFRWKGKGEWCQGHLKMNNEHTLLPLSVQLVKVKVSTNGGSCPSVTDELMVNVRHHEKPLVFGGPYLVRPDAEGNVTACLQLWWKRCDASAK